MRIMDSLFDLDQSDLVGVLLVALFRFVVKAPKTRGTILFFSGRCYQIFGAVVVSHISKPGMLLKTQFI